MHNLKGINFGAILKYNLTKPRIHRIVVGHP